MTTPVLSINDASITRAADMLREGKLVAFPTETVYGLGADATNGTAVATIYAAKGRPSFNPLIIHVAETGALEELVEWNETAQLLATIFWPGPLTLVMKRKATSPVSLLASAGLDTLAVRIPCHPAAQKLLRAVNLPIAAPSANASGKLSPTTAAHVADSLGNKVDLILAGGRTHVGLESTVVDTTLAEATILRHGGITQEQLETALERKIAVYQTANAPNAPASPGMLASHYAPNLPIRLNAISATENEVWLGFGPEVPVKAAKSDAPRLNLSPHGDLHEAASNLFAMLRELDQPGYSGIAIAPIPQKGLGVAINDRLSRAAIR